MSKLDDAISVLDPLIAFPTVSTDPNRDCIDWIVDVLEQLGARVDVTSDTPGKANLFATLGPDVDGGIILSGHTDVVPVTGQKWSSDPFVMRQDAGKLYGRGACDMKGFIAACLAMAPDYAAMDLKRPVHFAFTYDEETGCLGARVLIDQMIAQGLKPSICIVGEPTEMRIIEAHKGCCEYTCEFSGVEGHSSQPDLGVNALEYAARYVARLMELRENLAGMAPEGSRFDPPHSTLQICGMHSGVAHNVIPNTATVEWEMRPVQDDDRAYIRSEIIAFVDDKLRPEMQAGDAGCDIVDTFVSEVAGFDPQPDSAAVAVVLELTGANTTDVVSFGTEAGMFQDAGVSSVICGPGSIAQAHKPDEFISVDQMAACLEFLDRLKRKLE